MEKPKRARICETKCQRIAFYLVRKLKLLLHVSLSNKIHIKKKTKTKNTTIGPDGYTGKLNQKFKKEIIPNLYKFFQKIEAEEMLLSSFSLVCITLRSSTKTLVEEKTRE